MATAPEPAASGLKIPELMSSVLQSVDEIAKNILSRLQTPEMPKGPEFKPDSPKEEPPPPKPSFEVPHNRNEGFVGRAAELGTLFAMRKPRKRGRMGLVGLGGIGKTELAVEFVYRIQEMSPETSVYWFGPDELVNGLKTEDFLNLDHETSSLLVVDASKQLVGSPLIHRLEKLQDFNGTILVLARGYQTARLLADPRQICELHRLEEDDSVVLLKQSITRQSLGSAKEEQLLSLIQSLSGLPRAIIQVANLINHTGMKVCQLLELCQKDETLQLRLFGRSEAFTSLEEDNSVTARGIFDVKAFRSTYNDASGVLFQLYFLGGASIPRSLFPIDPFDLILIMGVLEGHFLVFKRDDTYNIHPLVCLAMKASLATSKVPDNDDYVNREKVWHRKIVHTFSRHFPDPFREDRDWWKDTLDHILTGYDPKSQCFGSSIASIYLKESKYCFHRGLFSEALKASTRAKAHLPDPPPKDNLDVLEYHSSILRLMGKYAEALEVLKECPEGLSPIALIQKKTIEANLNLVDPDKGYDIVVKELGDIRKSKRDAKFSTPDFWKSENAHAVALIHQGDYKEAEAACRATLHAQTAKFGLSHEDVFTTAHILAEAQFRNASFEDVTENIDDVVHGRQSLLGETHPDTLCSKALRAEILLFMSSAMTAFQEAEATLRDCSAGLSKVFGGNHPVVLSCQSICAQALVAQGRYDDAQRMIVDVLTAREQGPWRNPKTHPDTLSSKHQLSELLRVKEGCAKTDSLSKEVLDERTAKLSNDADDFHPDQLKSLQHRAIVLSLLGGRSEEALSSIRLALSGRQAVLRPNHPDTLLNLTWYGEILRANLLKNNSQLKQRGMELTTIEGLHTQARDGLIPIFGQEHQATLQCITNLAFSKNERGTLVAYGEAAALYRIVFRANSKNLGALHPETLKSKTRLARAIRMADSGRAKEAREMWKEACDGFVKIFGADGYGAVIAQKEYEEFFVKPYPTP
jgi:tetratricopeptide (TPR) repeat protein